MSSNTYCKPEFALSCLTDEDLSDLICPDTSLTLPDNVWGSVWIDGARCKGCFTTKRFEQKSDFGNNQSHYTLKCYLDTPKSCCRCRVICGSTVVFDDKKVWEVVDEEVIQHPGCRRWELREAECNEC